MAHLYVTTDSDEAIHFIENTDYYPPTKHEYRDLEPDRGQELVEIIGFNPMCCVEMNGGVSASDLNSIALRLVREGLYVATDIGGRSRSYFPNDKDVRSATVRHAMEIDFDPRFEPEPFFCLLVQSNSPGKIREIKNPEP